MLTTETALETTLPATLLAVSAELAAVSTIEVTAEFLLYQITNLLIALGLLILVTDIKIDTNRRQVFKSDERIRLTGMEFSLLELLVSRSGEPFSRGEILKEVWGYTPERHVDTRVVDVHISRLRSKLEADPANPELILTARGTGYLFQRIVDIAPFDGK